MRNSDKDRLILALAAQLRAERQTREALAAVIGNGQLDREVLLAILEDPIPASQADGAQQGVTHRDLLRADALAAESHRPRARAA
jgi:hypothetical protein